MRAFRAWLMVAFIVLLPAGLVVAGIGVAARGDREVVPPVQRSVALPVEQVALDGAQPVTLALSWGKASPLLAPAWTGTVTAVHLLPGDRITTGARIVRIDGVWRVAVQTSSPLYAPVGPKSDSSLQRAALDVLRVLGYVVTSQQWDWRATRAMRALADSLGVSEPAKVSAVDPGWFVWLPPGTLTAGAVDLAVGAPAPAPGSPIVALAPRLRSISIDTQNGQAAPTLSASTRGSWTLRVGGVEIKLARFPITARDALTRVGDRLAISHPDTTTGKLSRSGSPKGWNVPTASVFIDKDGRTCLVLASAHKPVVKTLEVDVLPGGEPGVASVTGNAEGTLLIQSNPSRLTQPIRCN